MVLESQLLHRIVNFTVVKNQFDDFVGELTSKAVPEGGLVQESGSGQPRGFGPGCGTAPA